MAKFTHMKSWFFGLFITTIGFPAFGQAVERPTISCTLANQSLKVDGWLDEVEWMRADSISSLGMVEPVENGIPTYPPL